MMEIHRQKGHESLKVREIWSTAENNGTVSASSDSPHRETAAKDEKGQNFVC